MWAAFRLFRLLGTGHSESINVGAPPGTWTTEYLNVVVAPSNATPSPLMWVVAPPCIKYKKFDCLSNHCKMAYNFYPILVVKN